ncbi:MAG TPA: hypothetical protein VH478_08125 [Trebonia sp.]|nr:hypothetical protein [Trebonia sp.]
MIGRIREWFDGSGLYLAGAGVLLALALLSALLSLQVDGLMWTGQPASGTEQNGIVYYTWHGQSYTVDDSSGGGDGSHVTVYLNPGSPAGAVVNNPTDRLITELMVGIPFLASAGLVILGGTRNYRWKRRNAKRGTADWWMAKVPR